MLRLAAVAALVIGAMACLPTPSTSDGGLLFHTDAAASDAGVVDGATFDAAGHDVTPTGDANQCSNFVAADAATGGGSWPAQAVFHQLVNFQPAGAPPDNAVVDQGLTFNALRGYGWSTDLSAAAERAGLMPGEPLLDTYVAAGAQGRIDTWELIVPEGRYFVSVASGKPDRAVGPASIVAEGTPLFLAESTVRGGDYRWAVDQLVVVRDGRLSLRVGTGNGPTPINYVEVKAAFPDGSCTPRAEVCNGTDDNCDGASDEQASCAGAAACLTSPLASGTDLSTAGLAARGGTFTQGGWQVDAAGTRLERTLSGNFYQGTIAFEARGLLWNSPPQGNASCARTVFELNHGRDRDPRSARFTLVNLAAGCGGLDGGALRLALSSGFASVASAPLAASDDGAWHAVRVTWDAHTVSLYLDGCLAAQGRYQGPSVGRDPLFWFGSAGPTGDVTGAIFRHLQVCSQVLPP